MQRFAVIGLGRFGSRLAVSLALAGQDVIAIDLNPELVESLRDHVTLAVAMDANDEQALRLHGIDRVDVAVVGIGNNFEASALATVVLKQLGIPRVISRAASNVAARILARIGADEIVKPEDESADRWSARLLTPFLTHVPVGDGYSLVELKTPTKWVGKTLAALNLRAKMGVLVVAVKTREGEQVKTQFPDPSQPLGSDQTLVIVGQDAQLQRLPNEPQA